MQKNDIKNPRGIYRYRVDGQWCYFSVHTSMETCCPFIVQCLHSQFDVLRYGKRVWFHRSMHQKTAWLTVHPVWHFVNAYVHNKFGFFKTPYQIIILLPEIFSNNFGAFSTNVNCNFVASSFFNTGGGTGILATEVTFDRI